VSRLVVKLLLSIAAFPAAAVVGVLSYLAVFVLFRGVAMFGGPDWFGILFALLPWSVMSLAFIVWWLLIWRRSIVWTGFRRTATICVTVGCVMIPPLALVILTGAISRFVVGAYAFVALFITSIPFQLSLVWRSTRREEAERLTEWRAAPTPRCPYCQGALAGRMGARCPHCGGDLAGNSVSGATS